MTVRKLRQKAACRVAGYDSDRLNEYIADQTYDCAPSTVPGRARLFTEEDTVALYYFAKFVDKFRRPRDAAREACLIHQGLRQYPDATTLSVIEPHAGSAHIAAPGEAAVSDPHGYTTGGMSIFATRSYNVGHARRFVAHGFDEEFSTAGED